MILWQRGRFTRGWGYIYIYIYCTATIMIIVSPSAPFVYTATLLLCHYTQLYTRVCVCVCVSPTSRCTCHRFPSLWKNTANPRLLYTHIITHTHIYNYDIYHYVYIIMHIYTYIRVTVVWGQSFYFHGVRAVYGVRSERRVWFSDITRTSMLGTGV